MSTAETCRRGHERTPENVRERILKRDGKELLIRECRPCARLTAEARKAAAADASTADTSTNPVVTSDRLGASDGT